MTEPKTLAYLNAKWWYRLIKVTYLGALTLALIGFAVGIPASNGGFITLDAERTIVTCNSQEAPAPFPLTEVGYYYFSASDFDGSVFKYRDFFEGYSNEYAIRSVLIRCKKGFPEKQKSLQTLDVFAVQRAAEISRTNLSEAEKSALYNQDLKNIESEYSSSQKTKYLDYSFHLFDIQPSYNYITTFLYTLGAILGVLVFFEFIRRIFYYIVLGSLRPKKS